jgi:hypothetical protein
VPYWHQILGLSEILSRHLREYDIFINTRISEIFLLENLSINVPYHRLTMTIVCLNFYSGNLSHFQFIDSWSNNFDGLQDSSDGMICTYCKKFPNIAGPSSFISGNKSYVHTCRTL